MNLTKLKQKKSKAAFRRCILKKSKKLGIEFYLAAFGFLGLSLKSTIHGSQLQSIPNGHIALNAIQRRLAKVSIGDTISMSRFVPPEDFNLVLLTLELEFIKKGAKDEQVDAVLLSQQIQKSFINQVMTTGQRVTFEYHGNGYIFTVNQAAIEGQEKSKGIERGMLLTETYIVFEAPNSSGIKVIFIVLAI
ncbi:hypothetical protein CsSME_00008225 [Camellia sinensis var. sinensis]